MKQCIYYTCAVSGESRPIWIDADGAKELQKALKEVSFEAAPAEEAEAPKPKR